MDAQGKSSGNMDYRPKVPVKKEEKKDLSSFGLTEEIDQCATSSQMPTNLCALKILPPAAMVTSTICPSRCRVWNPLHIFPWNPRHDKRYWKKVPVNSFALLVKIKKKDSKKTFLKLLWKLSLKLLWKLSFEAFWKFFVFYVVWSFSRSFFWKLFWNFLWKFLKAFWKFFEPLKVLLEIFLMLFRNF